MRNKPHSIFVLTASGIACAAMCVFLLIFGGTNQSFDVFGLRLGLACFPSVVLGTLAVGVPFSIVGRWVFCSTSFLLIVLTVCAVAMKAIFPGEAKGLAMLSILALQLLGMLAILVSTLFLEIMLRALRKKQPAEPGSSEEAVDRVGEPQ